MRFEDGTSMRLYRQTVEDFGLYSGKELTEDELKAVVTHEFEDANLAFVRDIFVFVCFTALSFIDVKELTTDNIVDINGDKWIIGHRHKTGIPFQVKLMDVPLQIINRYKHLQEDKLVFGKMNYWSMCKKLKTVMFSL